jgi:serine 3-dehydrogenase (NADP+)
MGKLDSQVVIVVGASSGMGRATALACAAEGARTTIVARREGQLDELAAEITAKGGESLVCAGDISKPADMEAVVKATVAKFGGVNTLIVAAGTNVSNRKLTALDQSTWDKIISTNLTGAYNCTQAVLPQMRAQKGGLIVHIASVSGKWGDGSGVAYQASKHGMSGLAYGTMIEEQENGVRTTVIYPGLCDTPLLNNRLVPPTPEERERMMKPDDIAAACVFVASLPPRTYVPELVIMASQLQCVGRAIV